MRLFAAAAVAAVGILGSGCVGMGHLSNSTLEPYHYRLADGSPLKAAGPSNLMLAVKSKAGNAFGVVKFPRDLWAPFRWEVTAGQIDPGVPEVGPGFFCTELDERDSDPLVYYSLCAQPISGGVNAFVNISGSGNIGAHFFPGVHVLDFAIEADGDDLLFYARDHATGGGWTLVASTPFSGQTAALFPTIGAAQMPAGSVALFDDARVLSNGEPGTPLTDAQDAAHDVWAAGDLLIDAFHLLDGTATASGTVASDLADGLVALDAAIASVNALPVGAGAKAMTPEAVKKAAAKALAGARKKVVGAQGKIENGKPSTAVQKDVQKALSGLLKAVTVLDPYFE